MTARTGASPEDWQRFVDLGLTDDLLPVVSDTSLPISPRSRLGDIGKTPSVVNAEGHITGLARWTDQRTKPAAVKQWAKDGRLGICVQTRAVRALDVDIADAAVSAQVRELVELVLGEMPCRSRANSGKLLLAFRLPGAYAKRKIKTAHGGPIEFLATGQQFIAAGTHPSGARYEWQALDAGIPEVSAEDFEALWASLSELYGVEPADTGAREATSHDDPVRGLSDDDLRAALAALDPDMSYDDWVKVGQAIHHETRAAGIDLWDDWSAAGSEYPGRDAIEAKWASFGRNSGAVVTAGTLLHMANASAAARGTPLVLPSAVAGADEFPDGEPAKSDLAEWPTFTRDKAGRIEPTISNTVAAVRCHDFSQVRVGRDQFKDSVMVAYNCAGAWRPLKDTDYTQIRMQLEARGFKAPGRELVRDAVLKVAEDLEFDSAIQWGTSLHWDGVPRVDSFLARYFRTEDTGYAQAVSRYLWTALAGRMLTPGEEVHMVVVLVGEQGSGKSRGVRALVPEPDAYVEINLEHRDDNQARLMRGKLVGELGELRGLQTRDAEGIKAWITRPFEEWTPKYQEFTTKFPRRLVFIGTTNDDDFLGDPTGERRWLPINVGVTDLDAIVRDRDQLWAEAVHLYRQGGVQWSGAYLLAKDEHEAFKSEDAWDQAVHGWLAADAAAFDMGEEDVPRWTRRIKLQELMRQALDLKDKEMNTASMKRVARILTRLGFAKTRAKRGEGKSVWVATDRCVLNPQNSADGLV